METIDNIVFSIVGFGLAIWFLIALIIDIKDIIKEKRYKDVFRFKKPNNNG